MSISLKDAREAANVRTHTWTTGEEGKDLRVHHCAHEYGSEVAVYCSQKQPLADLLLNWSISKLAGRNLSLVEYAGVNGFRVMRATDDPEAFEKAEERRHAREDGR